MNENHDFEGADFDSEQINLDDEDQFKRKYSERHRRVIRVSRPPQDGTAFQEGGDQIEILSDGEEGRKEIISGTMQYRLDCGCSVENLKDTRREGNFIVCPKHALYCRLCSKIVLPNQLVYIRLNESYYHRNCALAVIKKILFEAELKPKSLSAEAVGELKALRDDILKEKVCRHAKQIAMKITDLFSRKRGYGKEIER